jgi:hypothetical protein
MASLCCFAPHAAATHKMIGIEVKQIHLPTAAHRNTMTSDVCGGTKAAPGIFGLDQIYYARLLTSAFAFNRAFRCLPEPSGGGGRRGREKRGKEWGSDFGAILDRKVRDHLPESFRCCLEFALWGMRCCSIVLPVKLGPSGAREVPHTHENTAHGGPSTRPASTGASASCFDIMRHISGLPGRPALKRKHGRATSPTKLSRGS